jgi:hypothetical protein
MWVALLEPLWRVLPLCTPTPWSATGRHTARLPRLPQRYHRQQPTLSWSRVRRAGWVKLWQLHLRQHTQRPLVVVPLVVLWCSLPARPLGSTPPPKWWRKRAVARWVARTPPTRPVPPLPPVQVLVVAVSLGTLFVVVVVVLVLVPLLIRGPLAQRCVERY